MGDCQALTLVLTCGTVVFTWNLYNNYGRVLRWGMHSLATREIVFCADYSWELVRAELPYVCYKEGAIAEPSVHLPPSKLQEWEGLLAPMRHILYVLVLLSMSLIVLNLLLCVARKK
jgi:hypothetical protein